MAHCSSVQPSEEPVLDDEVVMYAVKVEECKKVSQPPTQGVARHAEVGQGNTPGWLQKHRAAPRLPAYRLAMKCM